MSIDSELKKVEKFISSLKKTDIVELLWEKNGVKIGFKKDDETVENRNSVPVGNMKPEAVVPAEAVVTPRLPVIPEDSYKSIKSRMVGTFYLAPTPDSPAYVKVGDVVKSGQRICMIEAMKVMREITTKEDVKIVRILIENGHPVEYNQSMFLVEPMDGAEDEVNKNG